MKNIPALTFFLFISLMTSAQSEEFKEYSYSEFFQMIEEEKDSVFRLENAIITYDKNTDEDFVIDNKYFEDSIKNIQASKIEISKHLKLNNVHFLSTGYKGESKDSMLFSFGVIRNVEFLKSIQFGQTGNVSFYNCIFRKDVTIFANKKIGSVYEKHSIDGIKFIHSTFYSSFLNDINFYQTEPIPIRLVHKYNTYNLSEHAGLVAYSIFGRRIFHFEFFKNKIIGDNTINLTSIDNQISEIRDNDFNESLASIRISETRGFNRLDFRNNQFSDYVLFNIDNIDPKHNIDWEQFKNILVARNGYENFYDTKYEDLFIPGFKYYSKQKLKSYIDSIRYNNSEIFREETAIRSMFFHYYNQKFDIEYANAVYMEMKELETKRLEYLYKTNSNFTTYFKWKVNQFLKVFSDYGTEPSKAIIFSMYVILIFAFVYLLFPNSWDSHGKNRIIHRFTFFMKYMNRKQGIHEVYLEEKRPEIMEYKDFKNLIENSSEKVPGFFKATALPLYKWAISGTKLTASLLSRVDVMKGTWEDVPAKKRWWKFLFLIGAFLIAIIYDLIIKILNALMLSVNTFTTLGFGEIPIKGLPRYLAIVQGFIGWFMLTIFSVSLISQLLN